MSQFIQLDLQVSRFVRLDLQVSQFIRLVLPLCHTWPHSQSPRQSCMFTDHLHAPVRQAYGLLIK